MTHPVKFPNFAFVVSFALATVAIAPATLAQTPKNRCNLPKAIAAITQQAEHQKAYWGIAVQDIATDEVLYEQNGDRLFVPASNLKLFTTAAALVELGKDYQFRTELYAVGKAPHLERLILKGYGDPSLTTEQLAAAIAQLKTQGITHINEVIIDDSYYAEPALHPTWEWSDLPAYYATPVNSFILNENAVVLTFLPGEVGQLARPKWSDTIAARQWSLQNKLMTAPAETPYEGTITPSFAQNSLAVTGKLAVDASPDIWGLAIPKPADYALTTVELLLWQNGIRINSGRVATNNQIDSGKKPLATIVSADLSELLKTTNQDSHNLFAESLRHTLGQVREEATGTEAIASLLTSLNVDADQYVLKDGSGLSRHNLATPLSFVQTLDAMMEQPDAIVYKNSLAIAAQSGTLSGRFTETPIANQFFGKTGTMTGVSTLSGYLNLEDGRTLALSILVNQSEQSARVTRRGIDDIVTTINEWGQCSPKLSSAG